MSLAEDAPVLIACAFVGNICVVSFRKQNSVLHANSNVINFLLECNGNWQWSQLTQHNEKPSCVHMHVI